MAVTIGLIILARDSRSENIYGGVGVFSFIILGTLLTIFFYKALCVNWLANIRYYLSKFWVF